MHGGKFGDQLNDQYDKVDSKCGKIIVRIVCAEQKSIGDRRVSEWAAPDWAHLQKDRKGHEKLAGGSVRFTLVNLLPKSEGPILALIQIKWRSTKPVKKEKGKLQRTRVRIPPQTIPWVSLRTMLYVRLVRVQAVSRVTPGKAEKSKPRATVRRMLVTQVPRKLSHSAFGLINVLLGAVLMLLLAIFGEEDRVLVVRPALLFL